MFLCYTVGMKLISWNVNGLRSLEKNGTWEAFLALDADIFCLQETKAEAGQLSSALRSPAVYHSYFSSSKLKKGYSGVALYTKVEPKEVYYKSRSGSKGARLLSCSVEITPLACSR